MIISSATTVDEACWLEAQGVDAIIAQGVEAGGHRGIFLSDDLTTQIGTFALVPQIARAVSVPVIAAGGIADAVGVAAALALGAAAVQVGTAYLLCPEATTTRVHREALASPRARHTVLTNLFTGRPARGIVNRLITELGPISPAAPAFPRATAAVMPAAVESGNSGSGDFSPLWSGQNATGCKNIPAAELTTGTCRSHFLTRGPPLPAAPRNSGASACSAPISASLSGTEPGRESPMREGHASMPRDVPAYTGRSVRGCGGGSGNDAFAPPCASPVNSASRLGYAYIVGA